MKKTFTPVKIFTALLILTCSAYVANAQGGQKYSVFGNILTDSNWIGSQNAVPLSIRTASKEAIAILGNQTVRFTSLKGNNKGLCSFDSTGIIHPLSYSGNPGDVLNGTGLWVRGSSFSQWVSNGSNIWYPSGFVGINMLPTQPLSVAGNGLFTGNIFAQNGAFSNSISSGTIKITSSGQVDTIASTASTLQLSSQNVTATQSLSSGGTLTAGSSGPAPITIQNGSITSGNGTVNFQNNNLTTTGTLNAGSFQASYIKTDSIQVYSIIPKDSILYFGGNPYPLINIHVSQAAPINAYAIFPKSFYSYPNSGFSFVNSNTNNGPVYLTVGGQISDAELNVQGPYNGSLLFSATNNNTNNDVFTIDKNGNTFINGTVGINTQTVPNGYAFAVNGTMIAENLFVQLYANWPDYVFTKGYRRLTIEEKEKYYQTNEHLPGIDPTSVVKSKGLNIAKNMEGIVQNVEEDRLDITALNKRLKNDEEKIQELEKENEKLQEEVSKKK